MRGAMRRLSLSAGPVQVHRCGLVTPSPVECMGGRGWPPVPWWHDSGIAGLAQPARRVAATVPGLIRAAEGV